MKRIIALSVILGGLGSISALAAEPSEPIRNIVLQETAIRNSLWYGSSSAAGLAFKPYGLFNTLSFDYDGEFGEYRKLGAGKSSSDISVGTSGAAYVGKFLTTGGFSFKNIFEKDALYNVLMYELEDNMPYYPIDDKSSGWNKQEYLLNAGLSSPILWDMVSFGIKVDYTTKVGAKQLDPRGETYKYGIIVTPSVAVRLGRSLIGLSGTYSNGFERGTVSNNNHWIDPKVWQHRGLGESTQNKVGGNDGMKTHIYNTQRFGGALQYSLSESLFIEASFELRTTMGKENPKLPKRLGSIKENDINVDAAWIFGKDGSNKLSFNASCSLTDGIEYVQKLNTTAYQQEWMVLSENNMSTFTGVNARLSYDHLFGASDPKGYDWKVGGEAKFEMFDQSYLAPASTSNAMRLYAGALADKHFKMRKSSLLVGVHAGYALGLGEGYKCLSAKAYPAPIAMMNEQSAWLNASYVKAGGRVDWTITSGSKVNWVLGGKVSYIGALDLNKSRILCSATFGILF